MIFLINNDAMNLRLEENLINFSHDVLLRSEKEYLVKYFLRSPFVVYMITRYKFNIRLHVRAIEEIIEIYGYICGLDQRLANLISDEK